MNSPKKILLVDDETLCLHVLCQYLKEAGYAYDTAENGVIALTKLKNAPSHYSVVVLDRIMPSLNGLEVVRIMRGYPLLSNIPVVMLTHLSEKEDIIEALHEDIFDYLTKPADKALFIRLIERAVIESEKPKIKLI